MNEKDAQSLIEGCRRYLSASKLPTPLPTNPQEYAVWREKASAERVVDDDAEEAWFELDRLIANDPTAAWTLLTQLASSCIDDDVCAQIAAGPLNTFLHAHGNVFSAHIEQELMVNAGFRSAYEWLHG